jgi:hypothetical protein
MHGTESLRFIAILEIAVALIVALLLIVFSWRCRTSGKSIAYVATTAILRAKASILGCLIFIALVVLADFLLPYERIDTEVFYARHMTGDKIEVSYLVCCTAGELALCEMPQQPELSAKQAIVVQRSRILDRCSVEPSEKPTKPCKCS